MIKYSTETTDYEFTKMKPIGTKVLLKKLVSVHPDKKYGDILVPHSVGKNNSLNVAEVIEMGDSQECRDSGLSERDFVLYDYYSVFNDSSEYVITNIENIIMQVTPEEAANFVETSCIWK